MTDEMVEVVIDSIRVSLMSQQRIVILREINSERYLPIWIGVPEAESIAIALQQVEVVRPLTHDLLKKVFDAFEAKILRVEVISLNDDIYYGNIIASIQSKTIRIDSRPSDALALAVRANVPILVDRQVMDVAGLIPDEDLQKEGQTKENTQLEPGDSVQDDSGTDRLSIFEDFLDKLDKDKDKPGDEK